MKPPLYNPKFSTRGLFLFGFLLGLISPLEAQISTTIGSVVKGFSVPQHNEEGVLISKIAGAQANTVSPNRAVIKELVMEFYNKGEVSMKITSPKCDYWFLQNRLNTREGVTIERDNMILSAQNFQWEEKTKKGVLQKNVSVILKDFNLSKEILTNPVVTPSSSSLSIPSSPSIELPHPLAPTKEVESPLRLDPHSLILKTSTPQENPTP